MLKRLASSAIYIPLILTANTVDAKISRCTDNNGHVTFSDIGCPWNRPNSKPEINNMDKQLNSAITDVKQQVRRIHFYCHEGTKPFTKCSAL